MNEIQQRQAAGQAVDLESYVRRYPDLAEPLRALATEQPQATLAPTDTVHGKTTPPAAPKANDNNAQWATIPPQPENGAAYRTLHPDQQDTEPAAPNYATLPPAPSPAYATLPPQQEANPPAYATLPPDQGSTPPAYEPWANETIPPANDTLPPDPVASADPGANYATLPPEANTPNYATLPPQGQSRAAAPTVKKPPAPLEKKPVARPVAPVAKKPAVKPAPPRPAPPPPGAKSPDDTRGDQANSTVPPADMGEPYATVPPSAPSADAYQTVPPTHDAAHDETDGDQYSTRADTADFDAFATNATQVPVQDIVADWPSVPGYEITGELGRGGMGVVYKAKQAGLRRTVALKMILSGSYASDAELNRFRLEAEAVARLQHPNIVQIYEVGNFEGRPYFSLEFLDGGSLQGSLRGVLPVPRQAAETLVKLADAMHAAHERGIVHRDLKPANILLSATGEPKITDFGLAKNLEEDLNQTQSGQIMGTPSYMSPEQARGDIETMGPATDIYSLGAILYEMLTGRTPFVAATLAELLDQVRNVEAPRLRKFQPKLPYDLETICLKCLQKDPHKRYASALELADDLRRFLNGEPVLARRTPLWERTVKWTRRRPAMAAFLVLAIVSGIGASAVGINYVYRQFDAAKLSSQANKLLAAIEKEIGNQKRLRWDEAHWQDAAKMIDRIRGMIESDPQTLADLDQTTRDLHAYVNQEIENQKDHNKKLAAAQKNYKTFQDDLNVAMLNAMGSVGLRQEDSLLKVRTAAPAGLKIYGVTLDNTDLPDVSSQYLTEHQKGTILPGCYELLLAWANAEAYPIKKNNEDEKTQAKAALRILDRAEKLGLDTRAYHMRRGNYLLVLGDKAGADAQLALAQKQHAETATDNYLMGIEFYRAIPALREPQRSQVQREAKEHFQRAIDLRPDHYWANFTLGQIYLQERRWDAAAGRLTSCVQQEPSFKWSYPLRAYAHGMLDDFELAKDDFATAEKMLLAEKPIDKEILYSVYVNRGLMDYRHALFLARNKQKAQAEKAQAQAIEQYRKAIELVPEQYQAYANLAQIYQADGDVYEALKLLDKAVELEKSAPLYRTRARLQLRRRAYSAALADLDEAVKLSGGRSVALAEDQLERGRVLYRFRKFPEALKAFEEALDSHPGQFPQAHRLCGETLFELGRFPEALQAINRYLTRGGTPVREVFLARGLVHAKMGNYRAAIEDYTVALRADTLGDDSVDDPDDQRRKKTTALTYRGWAHLICEAPFLADKDFSEALKVEAKNSDALCGRGNARVLLGDYRAAVADAEEAVKVGPASARLLYNCGRVYARSIEKIDEAGRFTPDQVALRRVYFQRCLELVRGALQQLPANQRAVFWRDIIVPDPAVKSVIRTNEFAQLGQSLGR